MSTTGDRLRTAQFGSGNRSNSISVGSHQQHSSVKLRKREQRHWGLDRQVQYVHITIHHVSPIRCHYSSTYLCTCFEYFSADTPTGTLKFLQNVGRFHVMMILQSCIAPVSQILKNFILCVRNDVRTEKFNYVSHGVYKTGAR